ncbi:MAG TPA: bifunctional oligoribonuclease/PAP phosphatase NrnA [Saprospiraceae bacterium]|nr:bifunctional oligoribonuclease/PAP phosphatase NrnA [Saprospiraceae bacterium]
MRPAKNRQPGMDSLRQLIRQPSHVVIVTHKNPDGDALGSTLALSAVLTKLLHNVSVVLPNDFPPVFNFLPGIEKVIIGEMTPDEAVAAFEKADIIFCLDFNSLDRIDRFGLDVMASRAIKVLIDHHIDPEPFADFSISRPEASSTAELIYDFLVDMGLEKYIDVGIAEALYTGILMDTGSFRYATNPRLFEISAELKKLGMDDYMLQIRLFNSMTEKQLKLLGHCLANRMELIPEHQAGIIWLDKEDYKKWSIGRGDTEGIVNYILMVRNMKLAVFISEQQNVTKLSFRSKGNINVQEICHNYFNGGGHRNASGGQLKASIEETLAKVKEIIPLTMNAYQLQHEQ